MFFHAASRPKYYISVTPFIIKRIGLKSRNRRILKKVVTSLFSGFPVRFDPVLDRFAVLNAGNAAGKLRAEARGGGGVASHADKLRFIQVRRCLSGFQKHGHCGTAENIAGAGGPNEIAAKLLVNLIATLALACSGRSGRTATLDLHTGSAQSPSRNEHVVMAATGVDALTAALTLGSVGGSAKAAILILLTGLPAELALDMLQRRQSRLESTIDKR